MNDEKISLRIEGEELARIEAYLDALSEGPGAVRNVLHKAVAN